MKLDITFEQLHSGLRLTTIYEDEYYTQLYIGYSKKESTRAFKEYVSEEHSKIYISKTDNY